MSPAGAVKIAREPVANVSRFALCADDCTVDCGHCKGTGPGYSPRDSKVDAWAKYANMHPEVLASYRKTAGLWPMRHPNAHLGFHDLDGSRTR